jgi:hypothetical protein
MGWKGSAVRCSKGGGELVLGRPRENELSACEAASRKAGYCWPLVSGVPGIVDVPS